MFYKNILFLKKNNNMLVICSQAATDLQPCCNQGHKNTLNLFYTSVKTQELHISCDKLIIKYFLGCQIKVHVPVATCFY